MHSLGKMAAISYFPSIYDKTRQNDIWALFASKPKLQTTRSATNSSNMTFNAGAGQNSSITPNAEAHASCMTLRSLGVSGYQPLDVFGGTAVDHGSTSRSEAEELCELLIKLKEIELCNMIGETGDIQECK